MCEPVHDYKTDEEDMTPVNLPRKSDVQRQFEHTMAVHGFVEKSKGTNVPVPDEQKHKLTIDWSKISKGFKWAAMDADGRGWVYHSKPMMLSDRFAPVNNEFAHMFAKANRSKSNDWQDTLTERPEEPTVKYTHATTPATEPQNDFDINVSGRTVPDDESQPAQAKAAKHPHADFIAEALKDMDRVIEIQSPDKSYMPVELVHVPEDYLGTYKYRFADTVKPEVTSPLTDDEICDVWNKANITAPNVVGYQHPLRAIAIAAKIATLREIAAMPIDEKLVTYTSCNDRTAECIRDYDAEHKRTLLAGIGETK